MTWTPSEGLKRAEEVAAQIHDELLAAGVKIEPMYQWRMTQVIGAAIDRALPPEVIQSEVVSEGWTHTTIYTNGHRPLRPGTPTDQAMVNAWEKEDAAIEQERNERDAAEMLSPVSASVATALDAALAEPAPKKKGRGRPKGSGKKAKKAPKAEAAAEAQQPVN